MNESLRRNIKIVLVVWGMLSDVEGVLTDKLQASRYSQSTCRELAGVMSACAGPWQHAEGVKEPEKRAPSKGRRT